MIRREYVIESMSGALDKKYLRQLLEYSDISYEYPCKMTIHCSTGTKQYYVEESNIKGHGFIIIEWGPMIG